MNELKLVVPNRFQLSEGPQWLAASQQLIWVDIEGKEVHIYSTKTEQHEVLTTPQRVGAVIPAANGELVLALEDGLYALDKSNELRLLTSLEADMADNRSNDGKVDAAGRLWIGTMPMRGGEWTGALYSFEAGQEAPIQHVDKIGCSNGIDWSPDGRTMYYIDSPTKRVDAFDFDPELGVISNRRTVITFDDAMGVPDGMCTDEQGRLWVAHWGGGCVTCSDPETGKLIKRIELPVAQVTSCCFGGPELKTLYITTASVGLNEQQLQEQPLAGSVFSMEVEEKGKLNPMFKLSK